MKILSKSTSKKTKQQHNEGYQEFLPQTYSNCIWFLPTRNTTKPDIQAWRWQLIRKSKKAPSFNLNNCTVNRLQYSNTKFFSSVIFSFAQETSLCCEPFRFFSRIKCLLWYLWFEKWLHFLVNICWLFASTVSYRLFVVLLFFDRILFISCFCFEQKKRRHFECKTWFSCFLSSSSCLLILTHKIYGLSFSNL